MLHNSLAFPGYNNFDKCCNKWRYDVKHAEYQRKYNSVHKKRDILRIYYHWRLLDIFYWVFLTISYPNESDLCFYINSGS